MFCDDNLPIILIFFCCFRAMTQQSILHLVVNWEVFTINNVYAQLHYVDFQAIPRSHGNMTRSWFVYIFEKSLPLCSNSLHQCKLFSLQNDNNVVVAVMHKSCRSRINGLVQMQPSQKSTPVLSVVIRGLHGSSDISRPGKISAWPCSMSASLFVGPAIVSAA